MLVRLTYDDEIQHSGEKDQESKNWFFKEVLGDEDLILHSNVIGDEVGKIKVIDPDLPINTE